MDNYFSVLLVVLIGFSACQSEPEKKVVHNSKPVTANVESEMKDKPGNNSADNLSTDQKLNRADERKETAKQTTSNEKASSEKRNAKVEKPKSTKKAKPKKPAAKDKKLSADLVKNTKTASKKKKEKTELLPELVFDYKTYDFGIVNHGDTVTHKFYFVNEGDAPAIISEASSSCGCTVPEYPKKPIKPGQRTFIKAVFATKGKLNTQKKSITIKANTEPNYTTLYLEGEVYNRPKKKEPVDSTKLDSIKKAKKKAVKDSLKLKKKAGKKQNALKDKSEKEKEDLAKDSNQEKKKTAKPAEKNKKDEEIDYFLPPPKPKKTPKTPNKTSKSDPKGN